MNIKLLYTPSVSKHHTANPLLSLGVLKSYLESKGLNIGIDDLEIKCISAGIDLGIFRARKSVILHLLDIKHSNLVINICEKILSLSDINSYDMVGFSIMGTSQFLIALALSKYISEKTNKKIVLGGFYPQSNAYNIMKRFRFVDYIVGKEGEMALEMLLKEEPPEKIPFLHYRLDSQARESGKLQYIQVNKLPAPDFDGLPLELYKKYRGYLEIPYELARGCVSDCNFCSFPNYNRLRIKRIEKIIDDLKILKKKLNSDQFIFYNAELNMDNNWCKKFLSALIESGLDIKWTGYLIPSIDEELAQLLKKSMCKEVKIGVESGSDSVLGRMNKLHRVFDAQLTVDLLYKYGIDSYYFFMCGYPFETVEEHKLTVEFIKKNKEKIRKARVSCFELEYNSNMFENPGKYGINMKEIGQDIIVPTLRLPFDEVGGLSYADKYRQQLIRKLQIEKVFTSNKIQIPFDYCISTLLH